MRLLPSHAPHIIVAAIATALLSTTVTHCLDPRGLPLEIRPPSDFFVRQLERPLLSSLRPATPTSSPDLKHIDLHSEFPDELLPTGLLARFLGSTRTGRLVFTAPLYSSRPLSIRTWSTS